MSKISVKCSCCILLRSQTHSLLVVANSSNNEQQWLLKNVHDQSSTSAYRYFILILSKHQLTGISSWSSLQKCFILLMLLSCITWGWQYRVQILQLHADSDLLKTQISSALAISVHLRAVVPPASHFRLHLYRHIHWVRRGNPELWWNVKK